MPSTVRPVPVQVPTIKVLPEPEGLPEALPEPAVGSFAWRRCWAP